MGARQAHARPVVCADLLQRGEDFARLAVVRQLRLD